MTACHTAYVSERGADWIRPGSLPEATGLKSSPSAQITAHAARVGGRYPWGTADPSVKMSRSCPRGGVPRGRMASPEARSQEEVQGLGGRGEEVVRQVLGPRSPIRRHALARKRSGRALREAVFGGIELLAVAADGGVYEEVLQDGHWFGLLPTIRLQLALRHLRRDWYGLAWFYGLPGSAQSVPLCSPGMALADDSVAGPCSHLSGPGSFPDLRSSPASLQEVQLTAILGVALLSEASVSPFGSSFSCYVKPAKAPEAKKKKRRQMEVSAK